VARCLSPTKLAQLLPMLQVSDAGDSPPPTPSSYFPPSPRSFSLLPLLAQPQNAILASYCRCSSASGFLGTAVTSRCSRSRWPWGAISPCYSVGLLSPRRAVPVADIKDGRSLPHLFFASSCSIRSCFGCTTILIRRIYRWDGARWVSVQLYLCDVD
jgi:hypothetical protein